MKALLAVARSGSTAGAARDLRVNQTTVARRLEALERDFGMKLVDRAQTGATLTEAGLCLVSDGEAMERVALSARKKIEAHRRGVTGTLKITTPEMIAAAALTPLLPEFQRLYPDLTLELAITDEHLDLEAGEADIALRGGAALPDSNLVARRVIESGWALYCSRDYARRMGLPATPADLKDHLVIGGDDTVREVPGLEPILRDAPGVKVALKSSSLTNLFAAIRAGLGIGAMPAVLGDLEADLIQVFPPHPESMTFGWLLTRPELKDAPRVRAFMDFFAPRIIALFREYRERAVAARAPSAP